MFQNNQELRPELPVHLIYAPAHLNSFRILTYDFMGIAWFLVGIIQNSMKIIAHSLALGATLSRSWDQS